MERSIGRYFVMLHFLGGNDKPGITGERARFGAANNRFGVIGKAVDGVTGFIVRRNANAVEDTFQARYLTTRFLEMVLERLPYFVGSGRVGHVGHIVYQCFFGVVHALQF